MRFVKRVVCAKNFIIGAAAAVIMVAAFASGQESIVPQPLNGQIGVRVEFVGQIPVGITFPFSYNRFPAQGFPRSQYFIDQAEGIIYESFPGSQPEVIFDLATDAPEGLDFNYTAESALIDYKVHNMAPGTRRRDVIVVFESKTLPEGIPIDSVPRLPPPQVEGICDPPQEADIWRVGQSCLTSETVYTVFYKFKKRRKNNDRQQGGGYYGGNGGRRRVLKRPRPFFAIEQQRAQGGHMGGALLSLGDGRYLWSTADCLFFGFDGRAACQDPTEHCGKLLLIDSSEIGSYEIVAAGVRNSPQIYLRQEQDGLLVFADVGGVTAEEVNAIKLEDLLNATAMPNFGWGRNVDGFAREGTFYIEPGVGGTTGSPPLDAANAPPIPEPGFIQPWVQFGRGPGIALWAISSSAISDVSFRKIKLAMTELNTGLMIVALTDYQEGAAPATAYTVPLLDENGTELEAGFNSLVQRALGLDFPERGDPRLFVFPDGTAGVFIERTGEYYRLREVNLPLPPPEAPGPGPF